jgi:hypothetical protein
MGKRRVCTIFDRSYIIMGTFDLGKVVGLMLTIVLIGVILKDNSGFDNVMKGLNSTLSTLEAAG